MTTLQPIRGTHDILPTAYPGSAQVSDATREVTPLSGDDVLSTQGLAYGNLGRIASALIVISAIATVFAALPSICVAESLVSLSAPTPPIYLRICWTLEAAVAQAKLAKEHAKSQNSYRFVAAFEHPQCEYLNVSVWADGVEQKIEPFLGWAIVYDPAGTKTVTTLLGGRRVDIPAAMVKDTVTYYYGRVSSEQKIKPAWLELPREPYVLKYLVEKGALRR